MKQEFETIIYCEFYDHCSSTNEWQDYPDLEKSLSLDYSVMKVCGKLYKEDDIAYTLITMWGDDCAGSGHLIIKSTITREIRWKVPVKHPKKSVLKPIQ